MQASRKTVTALVLELSPSEATNLRDDLRNVRTFAELSTTGAAVLDALQLFEYKNELAAEKTSENRWDT